MRDAAFDESVEYLFPKIGAAFVFSLQLEIQRGVFDFGSRPGRDLELLGVFVDSLLNFVVEFVVFIVRETTVGGRVLEEGFGIFTGAGFEARVTRGELGAF